MAVDKFERKLIVDTIIAEISMYGLCGFDCGNEMIHAYKWLCSTDHDFSESFMTHFCFVSAGSTSLPSRIVNPFK